MPNLRSEYRKLSEIVSVPYVEFGVNCDPSQDDIQNALDEDNLEKRGYQSDLKELKVEWFEASNNRQDVAAWIEVVKSYHARRIAWFVRHGWDDLITIDRNGNIKDGLHRLHAAKHLGREKIAVVIEG